MYGNSKMAKSSCLATYVMGLGQRINVCILNHLTFFTRELMLVILILDSLLCTRA